MLCGHDLSRLLPRFPNRYDRREFGLFQASSLAQRQFVGSHERHGSITGDHKIARLAEPWHKADTQSFVFAFEPSLLEGFGALDSDFAVESGFADAASPADLSAFAASLYDLLR